MLMNAARIFQTDTITWKMSFSKVAALKVYLYLSILYSGTCFWKVWELSCQTEIVHFWKDRSSILSDS